MNLVILLGNITQDLELKQLDSGMHVLNFSIATNKKVKVDEEWVDKAEFHNCVAWGKRAEAIANFMSKGSEIMIKQGELQTRSWDDSEGNKRYKTEVLVNDFAFTRGSKRDSDESENTSTKKVTKKQGKGVDVNDIPF